MERSKILAWMRQVLKKQGRDTTLVESDVLRDVGFRSLDFSEVALMVENEIGRELNFEASRLRAIQTVGDVLDFMEHATRE